MSQRCQYRKSVALLNHFVVCASNAGGISSPSDFAVVTSITRLNLDGRITSRSAGRSPLLSERRTFRLGGNCPLIWVHSSSIHLQRGTDDIDRSRESHDRRGPRRALDRPQIAGCTQQPACLLFPRATPQLKRFRAARQPDLVGNPRHLLSMPGEAQRTGAKRRPSAPAR